MSIDRFDVTYDVTVKIARRAGKVSNDENMSGWPKSTVASGCNLLNARIATLVVRFRHVTHVHLPRLALANCCDLCLQLAQCSHNVVAADDDAPTATNNVTWDCNPIFPGFQD